MRRNGLWAAALSAVVAVGMVAAPVQRAAAQDAGSTAAPVRLWVDQRTGQVFIRPGRGRVPLTLSAPDQAAIERQVEQKVEAKTRDQLESVQQSNAQLQQQNATLTQQVSEMQPGWQSYLDNFQDKIRIGTLLYGDYRFYTNTGFQPQELTQLTNPGPGNNKYNSFDITRTYLNFFFFPTPDWSARLTPNMYKTIGTASNDKVGQTTGFGSNLDGDLGVRMKYALLQYNSLWANVPALKGGTVSLGEIPNPLVDWEENLYGFRYVNLTPWNYLSLSSTQIGVSMQGPIKPFGPEKMYLDYDFGAYDNSSFHAFEQTDTKQFMGRLTAYPFGALWRYDGLGLTGFYNYGYGNTAPDTVDLPTAAKGPNSHITRIAALLHYSAEEWNVAGEFDYGKNAFSAANLFSGSGPLDEFGTATGTPIKSGTFAGNTCGNGVSTFSKSGSLILPCYPLLNTYGPQTAAWNAILNNGQAEQIGFDAFGHYHIPETPITLFGMFQWFEPNQNFHNDPLDFQRFIVGVSYQYNEYLRFAVDTQNFSFYHDQQTIPITQLKKFGYSPGGTFNNQLLPKTGSIPDMVTRDTHAIFGNVEFNY
jgi:hypothetical protein